MTVTRGATTTSGLAALVLVFALSASAWAQMAADPLTGGTPDAGAALGFKPVEAVYFDAKGNVTDDASQAVKFAVTDNVKGTSTLPKPMAQMTAEERQRIGLPAAEDAKADKQAAVPAEKPAPKPDQKAEAKPKSDEPAAKKDAETKVAAEPKDTGEGSEFAEVTPSLVDAARGSLGTRSGQSFATGPAEGGASGEAAAHLFIAPAVTAHIAVMSGPAGAVGRGYRTLTTLVNLRDQLVAQARQYLGGSVGPASSSAGGVYDGTATLPGVPEDTREADARFGIAQQSSAN